MRENADAERVRLLVGELGRVASQGTRVYLVGGATAVLEGWRATTIDVDIRIEPESDAVLRQIPRLKESLDMNIEFASPADFIPELPGWRERSRFRFRSGNVEAFDYDLYSQALAKIERGFDTDLGDVEAMLAGALVEPMTLQALFREIEPELFRFPAIDAGAFRDKVERALR